MATQMQSSMRAWRRLATALPHQTTGASTFGSPRGLGLGHAARRYSTAESDPAPPPLLAKLKGDLKTAMRAKDAPRLAVLRTILSATLNASKTSQPITSDAKLVALLRKTARSYQTAADEFRGAGRPDLVEKEEAQIRILDEYSAMSGVQVVEGDALRAVVRAVIDGMDPAAKKNPGTVMKELLKPGGPLRGKEVDKSEAGAIAGEELAKS